MQVCERWILRPRPHQTHPSPEDVPELRDLVKLGLREESADPREAIVARCRERRAGNARAHLSELEHREGAPAAADAVAAKEDGTAAVKLHGERDEDDQR